MRKTDKKNQLTVHYESQLCFDPVRNTSSTYTGVLVSGCAVTRRAFEEDRRVVIFGTDTFHGQPPKLIKPNTKHGNAVYHFKLLLGTSALRFVFVIINHTSCFRTRGLLLITSITSNNNKPSGFSSIIRLYAHKTSKTEK